VSSGTRFSQSARVTDIIANDVSDLSSLTPRRLQQLTQYRNSAAIMKVQKANNNFRNAGLGNLAIALLCLPMSANNTSAVSERCPYIQFANRNFTYTTFTILIYPTSLTFTFATISSISFHLCYIGQNCILAYGKTASLHFIKNPILDKKCILVQNCLLVCTAM
jgi:hypothetical protein